MPRPTQGYLDTTGSPDRLSGGVRMIPVSTPSGEFRVWTNHSPEGSHLAIVDDQEAWFDGLLGFLARPGRRLTRARRATPDPGPPVLPIRDVLRRPG